VAVNRAESMARLLRVTNSALTMIAGQRAPSGSVTWPVGAPLWSLATTVSSTTTGKSTSLARMSALPKLISTGFRPANGNTITPTR
jgi:hypothetical protein